MINETPVSKVQKLCREFDRRQRVVRMGALLAPILGMFGNLLLRAYSERLATVVFYSAGAIGIVCGIFVILIHFRVALNRELAREVTAAVKDCSDDSLVIWAKGYAYLSDKCLTMLETH